MEGNQPTTLELTSLVEYEGFPYNIPSEAMVAMANVKAPLYEPKERAPLNLVAVIDRSGSMNGEKLRLVKKTLEFVVKQLNPRDSFAMVTFESTVETNLKFTVMNSDGKDTARRKIQAIETAGCTNLSGGLFAGMELIEDRHQSEKEITSVLLMTDGRANEGISKPSELVEAFTKQAATKPGCTLFTFGYGSDHDDKLLKDLSEISKGLYYYVEKEDDIPQAFGDCLGGLISVVAQNMKLSFVPLSGTVIKRVITKFQTSQSISEVGETVHEVNIGDLYSEEVKNFLVEIELSALPHETPNSKILASTLSFFDILAGSPRKIETILEIDRMQETIRRSSIALDKQKNRVLATDAMETADALGKQSKIDEANKNLQEAIDRIKASISAEDPLCQDLINDLIECKKRNVDYTSYSTTGTKYLKTRMMSHGYERSSHTSPMYTTSAKQRMMHGATSGEPDDEE